MAIAGIFVAGCASSSLADDAAIACGWDEPREPVVSAVDASSEQLARNAARAERRLRAAERVVAEDDRFAALVDALAETADFAVELQDMSRAQITAIENERWDFAKYAQAVARDQCEQLAAVVGRE